MQFDVVLDLVTADEDEWKLARMNGITGSDCAAILGVDRWKSRYTVYQEKVAGQPPSVEETERMRWGTLLEDPVRREFAHRHRGEYTRVVKPEVLVAHVEHEWMLCTPDGFIDHTGIYEGKTTNRFLEDDWREGVPDRAAAQTAHELAVTGAPWAWVAVLIGGNHYEDYFLERDDALIDTIIDRCGTFWHDNVLARKAPPLDPQHPSTQDTIRSLWPDQAIGSVKELPSELHELALELFALRAETAIAARREKALKTEILAFAEDAEILTWGGDPIMSLKTQQRAGYAVEPGSSRVMRKMGKR